MIVTFSVGNYRSFSTEETLSLVASKRLGDHPGHLTPIPNSEESALRASILYGANGAGKSNLFAALKFAQEMAVETRQKKQKTGRVPFRLSDSESEPTTMDLQFIASDKLYRFGLRVDDDRVVEEWLFRVRNGKQTRLYHRATTDDDKVEVNAAGLRSAGEKVRALALVGGPPNQSFLATVKRNLKPSEVGTDLVNVLRWFTEGLTLISPDARFIPLAERLIEDSTYADFASYLLRGFSTGVSRIAASRRPLSQSELSDMFPKHELDNILRMRSGAGKLHILGSDGKQVIIESEETGEIWQADISTLHSRGEGGDVAFLLGEESDGTRRLLDLSSTLYEGTRRPVVHIIDEIDRSLHPILVKEFLRHFLEKEGSPQRQLIVTTHESSLLDQELLRRDEIWFAEKDHSAATRLYSLLDFNVRNDLELRKHYLRGRFGAIPFIGDIKGLTEGPAGQE